MIFFLLSPAAVLADDGPNGVVEVGCASSSGGEIAYANITLYQPEMQIPIAGEYEKMWAPFTLYVHDGNDNLLQTHVFEGAHMYLEFTEPGDYYISIYDARGRAQGRFYDKGDGTVGYDRSPIHLKVSSFSEITEDGLADHFAVYLSGASPEERDAALREWLVFLHLNGFSHAGLVDELGAALADCGDEQLLQCYDLLLQNEGYLVMAGSGPMIYDYELLREDSFWKYEYWRFAADGGEIPPEVMAAAEFDDYAYFEEYMGRTDASSAPESDAPSEDAPTVSAGSGVLPYGLIGSGAAAVIAAVLILKRKKK